MSAEECKFIECLKKEPQQRAEQDLSLIFAFLHGMEALASLREPALRALCKTARYVHHDANDIIYCQGELASCWYILLSGSVFIEGSMFLPRSSFGKRSQGCARRTSECLTLEPSEMIAIDYPDVQAHKGGQRNTCSANLDRLLSPNLDPHLDLRTGIRRMNSDSVIEQLPVDGGGAVGLMLREPFLRHDQLMKRSSRASDTSSAYSGSDMMQSSLEDPDNPEADMSGLVESMVDSDDEEGYAESTESIPNDDTVRDCLEKTASERTEDDIEILMEFMQHFRAFANMTQMTRRALCSVMVFAVVPREGTVVMKDGEELDSWSVILNGEVEITRPDGSVERLQMGDSFGITPTIEKLYHNGVMRTMVDDCQFVCIAQQDYYHILNQEKENTQRHEEQGQVVMVTEHRELEGGNRKGQIVIRGTPARLMQHLVEDHSAIDPTYVEDFLLTYRTFLDGPIHLANSLLHWFDNPSYRPRVTRVVLFWVNNHFNDFETDPAMCEFLEHFECLLEQESETDFERMVGQMSLLNMACTAKAKVRTVTLMRTARDEILHFSILGGQERGHGIFITKVDKGSKAAEVGLKRGDQILEVNGTKFQQIYYNKALEILRGSTHLCISVKSNLQDFKEMLRSAEKNTPRKVKRDEAGLPPAAHHRLSAPDLEVTLSFITTEKEKKPERKGFFGLGTKPRIKKALEKMNILPKMNGNINHSDESLYSKPSRKSSSSSSSSTTGFSNHLSASNPDISSLTLGVDDRSDYPEHVVKVYRADQSFKFLLIHKETTAKEVVMLALQEFGITESSCNFSLCEVTVESEMFIKRRRLPDQLANLPDRLNLNSRYYIKNNLSTDPLIPDEMIGELLKESQISLLQLNPAELAWQLTLEDFKVFREIEPTEYVDELFELNSKYGCPMIQKFAELVNREMFWVVTEVCSEPNLVRRMKMLKHFIKIAKFCKDYKNFNSMFAIMSGLRHGSVSRLRSTWEKLPNKYLKMFEDLETLMDPSRNMAKYRNLLNSDHVQPPVIPIFPVVKKDLTFIHLGNDSLIDGIVNFEKLRMIAKEIRHIGTMCSARYDVSNMLLSTHGNFSSSLVSGMATLKRTKNRRASTVPNPKKMYEEAQMVRKVRSYLSTMPVNTNEDQLAEMSNQCEPPARKRDVSPGINNSSPNLEDKRAIPPGPKFGTESPGAVRKIMALTDKVRPHNPKIPVPPVTSPGQGRRGPSSPRHTSLMPQGLGHTAGQGRMMPVRLTHESSSVVSLSNMPLRKPLRTDKVSDLYLPLVYGSLGSMEVCMDNDSGCAGMGSTLTLKSGASYSPAVDHHVPFPYHHPGVPVSQHRPPLPTYSVAMNNTPRAPIAATTHSSFPGYPHIRRPPLPDYQAAAQMAQLHRHKMERTHSHNGAYMQGQQDYDIPCGQDPEEEQVSAV